jgi:hypothetical protein
MIRLKEALFLERWPWGKAQPTLCPPPKIKPQTADIFRSAEQPTRKTRELAAVTIICVLTMIGLVCASVGVHVLPKCRYGSPECYFIVEICAYSDIKNAPATPGTGTAAVTSLVAALHH